MITAFRIQFYEFFNFFKKLFDCFLAKRNILHNWVCKLQKSQISNFEFNLFWIKNPRKKNVILIKIVEATIKKILNVM